VPESNGTALLLTDAEAAALLGVRPSTVRQLHRTRILRGVVLCRQLRWSRDRVEQFAQERAAAARAEEL